MAARLGVEIRLPDVSPQPYTRLAFEGLEFAKDNGAFTPLAFGAQWLPGTGVEHQERMLAFDHVASTGVHLSDRSAGRVGLAPGGTLRITYRLHRDESDQLVFGIARAAELMFTGRAMTAEEGERWGFFNQLVARDQLLAEASRLAKSLATGPMFAHSMTKTMLNQEWSMSIDQALEAEAQAQAICMQTEDFRRAFDAFAAKRKPEFVGK